MPSPRKAARSLQDTRRAVRISFGTLEEFRQEYRQNLIRGGLFVPCDDAEVRLREEVEVELDLVFRSAVFRLPAEVVAVVPGGLARTGATPGLALQLQLSPDELRRRFEDVVGQVAEPDRGQQVGERRAAARHKARVMGRLSGSDGEMAVRTRDLSRSGVLVSIDGIPPVPVGEDVHLTLTHPVTGQTLDVSGRVVRHVEGEGSVPALAVAFTGVEAARPDVQRFVDALQSFAHARKLAAISGSVEELGLAGLLQSFAGHTPRGTMTLTRGSEDGHVLFEGGRLLAARLGAASGTKALARLMDWTGAHFDFHAQVDGDERDEPVLPLEVALLEAARQVDELHRLDPLPVDAWDVLEPAAGAAGGEPACKTEAAVLDLARAGFTVRAMLDVIPEEDHVILRAVCALLERGAVGKAR